MSVEIAAIITIGWLYISFGVYFAIGYKNVMGLWFGRFEFVFMCVFWPIFYVERDFREIVKCGHSESPHECFNEYVKKRWK